MIETVKELLETNDTSKPTHLSDTVNLKEIDSNAQQENIEDQNELDVQQQSLLLVADLIRPNSTHHFEIFHDNFPIWLEELGTSRILFDYLFLRFH